MKWFEYLFCQHDWELGYKGVSFNIAYCKKCMDEKRFWKWDWEVYQAKKKYKEEKKK